MTLHVETHATVTCDWEDKKHACIASTNDSGVRTAGWQAALREARRLGWKVGLISGRAVCAECLSKGRR